MEITRESVIVIVGFLGAGKTTLLKNLTQKSLSSGWDPHIILNDYENAQLDSQRFFDFLTPDQVKALSGSCICCSGAADLRNQVNLIPRRKNAITFIEANGTTDACALMEFLGVGLNEQFTHPVQISVVDARNWQKRGEYNELEANQIQVSSLVALNHLEGLTKNRIDEVREQILQLNPSALIQPMEELDIFALSQLETSTNKPQKMDHWKAHWSSCSVDLPDPFYSKSLMEVIESLPKGILRVKGCTRLDEDEYYSFFERVPTGETMVRSFGGKLVSGPKLLVVGPGSDPEVLKRLIEAQPKPTPRSAPEPNFGYPRLTF